MISVLLVAVVAILALFVFQTRRARTQWERRLSLPGVWKAAVGDREVVLRLSGSLTRGDYVESHAGSASTQIEGHWRLAGSQLHLQTRDGVDQVCELRLLEDHHIGLDGPQHEGWRMERMGGGNVVPLRSARN